MIAESDNEGGHSDLSRQTGETTVDAYERHYASRCKGGEITRLEECGKCEYQKMCYRNGNKIHKSEDRPTPIQKTDLGLWNTD